MKTNYLFLSFALFVFFSNAQSIEKFSVDSGGAASSVSTLSIVYTIGEVNVAERSNTNIKLSEGFLSKSIKVRINPKVFLQGPALNPMMPDLMNDNLRNLGLLPTTSPFPDAGTVVSTVFNLGGTSSLGVFDDDIVDWIWLELRDETDEGNVIIGISALLQRDGDVVSLDGVSSIRLGVAPKNYFVVLKHRNHLGVMSLNPIAVTETGVAINFTDSATNTYGTDAQVTLSNGNKALWAGNVNNDNVIRFSGSNNDTNTIKDEVLNDPSNGFSSVTYTSIGYKFIDINMNGGGVFSGANNDSNINKDNVLQHPGNGFNSPTYTISTTVPAQN